MSDERKFDVGHRVMITDWGKDLQCGPLTGYYGRIQIAQQTTFWVRVEGRVGASANPLITDANLWPFKAHELEHAD